MKRTRPPIILVAGAAALVATIAVTPAHAGNPCLSEAKRDYRDCTADCKEAFQTAKDACLNRDHACVEVCRADRSQCRLDTGFDAAIEACNDLLEARRIRCRQDNLPGEERDRCIDLAQIEAFQCRDAARELAKPLLKQCRKAFRACARACGPAAAGDPPPDPRQCLTDANIAFRACLKSEDAAAPGCRESFQIAKDDCRGRDHECVEVCREARHACRLPIRAQLEADLAACAATGRQRLPGTAISLAVCSSSPCFRLAITTLAPASRNAEPMALPMPRDPPVIKATLLSSRNLSVIILFSSCIFFTPFCTCSAILKQAVICRSISWPSPLLFSRSPRPLTNRQGLCSYMRRRY